MAGYSRMVIMSMSEEEIKRVLTEERDSLSDYAAFMMVEELKRRKEQAEKGEELSEDASCDEALEEEYGEELDEEALSEEEPSEDYEFVEDIEDIADVEALEAEDLAESLSDEERAERKRQRQIEELEKIREDRKKTLIFACVGTVVAALAIVGFMVYLSVSGQL